MLTLSIILRRSSHPNRIAAPRSCLDHRSIDVILSPKHRHRTHGPFLVPSDNDNDDKEMKIGDILSASTLNFPNPLTEVRPGPWGQSPVAAVELALLALGSIMSSIIGGSRADTGGELQEMQSPDWLVWTSLLA